MLSELVVQDLALVEKITLHFSAGLNVITGETGAGKSVLMGALQLILGARADKKVLRSGVSQGSVRAMFILQEPERINDFLVLHGLDVCEDDVLLLRRIIKANGKGQQFVNDTPVTISTLRELGNFLVDMHGPYDHQSLVQPDTQRAIVDTSGVESSLLEEYANSWKLFQDLLLEQEALQGDDSTFLEQLDLLRYRVNELEEAALISGEEEALLEEHTFAGNAYNHMESVSGALRFLEESEGNATDALCAARRLLESITHSHPDAGSWTNELDALLSQLKEVGLSLRIAGEQMEVDPARLDWLDKRLSLYSRMRKKYGPEVEDALATLEASKLEIESLEQREDRLDQLMAETKEAEKNLYQIGETLMAARKQAATQLEGLILQQLKDLGFPYGRFKINITPAQASAKGIEKLDFEFAPNPGEDIRSLKAIASSGEISRVMLALKTLLAESDQIPVMVFDEIDANVGGEMGHAIGEKMAEAGRTRQVISITHLPQVAVHGQAHLAVSKEIVEGRTYTRVNPLVGEDRVDEVARMLGGKKQARLSMDHARELLENVK